MARRKIKNGIFFPAPVQTFPCPTICRSVSEDHFQPVKQALFFRVFQAKQARSARHGRWGETPSSSPVSRAPLLLRASQHLFYRPPILEGLRFLSLETWKIVGNFRRYLTSFPGCQSYAPNMPCSCLDKGERLQPRGAVFQSASRNTNTMAGSRRILRGKAG